MAEYRSSSHTEYDIKYPFVWITKYQYKILSSKITERARDIIAIGLRGEWNNDSDIKRRCSTYVDAVSNEYGNR